MPLTFVQTVAPTAEPILWDEAKVHLRLDSNDEQTMVEGLIAAARTYAEEFTQRQLITATWQLSLDEFPSDSMEVITLHRPPLAAITSVYYLDGDGVSTLMSSSLYQADYRSTPGRLVAEPDTFWPVTETDRLNAVTILYTSGYGAAGTSVPRAIRQAMLLMIGAWYENRENIFVGVIPSKMPAPMAADALLSPFRVMTQI